MKKEKIIIIILSLVIALLLVYIFWGQSLLQTGSILPSQQSETLTTEASSLGESSKGVIPQATSEYTAASEDVFTDPDAAAGQNVQIEGTVYDDPKNNQGILAFNIKTDDMHLVFVNYLDLDETVELEKGDKVIVKGVVTSSVQSEDENGLLTKIPMVNASSLEEEN